LVVGVIQGRLLRESQLQFTLVRLSMYLLTVFMLQTLEVSRV